MESIVAAFVREPRQERYLELLKNERGRRKIRNELAHFTNFSPQAIVHIPAEKQTPPLIERLLLGFGASRHCSIFSELEDCDASDIPLRDALDAVVGRGIGAIISCGPSLAYYESEDPGIRFILRKD